MDNKKIEQLENLMSQFNQDSKRVVELLENINQFCEGTHQASSLLKIFSALNSTENDKKPSLTNSQNSEKPGFYLSCGQHKSKIVDDLEIEFKKVNNNLIFKRTPAEFNDGFFQYGHSDNTADLESAKGNSAYMMRSCNFFAVFLDNYTLTDDLHRYELDYIKNQKNVIYVISEQLLTWA